MIAAIMQPYFIPYIGYFQLMQAADTFLAYGKVSFRKKSWINRNRLINKSAKQLYTEAVPLLAQSSNKRIDEIYIDNTVAWRRSLLKRLMTNYSKASFFEETYPVVEHLLLKTDSLYELNVHSLRTLAAHLNISTNIVVSNLDDYDEIENGLARQINAKEEVKSERVYALMRHINCSIYLNPTGGRELYCKHAFTEEGLTLKFLESVESPYQQFSEPFHPYLSIIDVLMHAGKDTAHAMLSSYRLD